MGGSSGVGAVRMQTVDGHGHACEATEDRQCVPINFGEHSDSR
jgi:hypothetical protein